MKTIRFILNFFFKQKPVKRYPMTDRNNIIHKSNNALQVTVGILLFILISLTGKSQVFAEMGPGMTNSHFSGELQVGYRYNNTMISIGYIAMPNANQPVIFNVRGGAVLLEKVVIYGGYVRTTFSIDDKYLNKNNWQIGGQYHLMHYDKGTVYAGLTFTNPGYTSVHVGMSWNLFRPAEYGCKY